MGEIEKEPSPEPTNEATKPGATWSCQCGAVNFEKDKSCSVCESEKTDAWICPDCGTKNEPYRLTCVYCYCGKP